MQVEQKQGPSGLGTFGSGRGRGLPRTMPQGGGSSGDARAVPARTSEGKPVLDWRKLTGNCRPEAKNLGKCESQAFASRL